VSGSNSYKVVEGDIITCVGCEWEGSLGFYIEPDKAVTNKHVIPNVGHKVLHRTEPWKNGREIGVAIKTVKWRNPTFFDWLAYILIGRPIPGNKVDATLIQLNKDVAVERAFNLPTKIAEPKKGAKLYKRGRTTGVTEGLIQEESIDVWVGMGDGRRLLFTDVYMFSNRTMAGDSGGPNYTDDGIVGLTFAGPERGEYGFGIKARNIAEAFGLG